MTATWCCWRFELYNKTKHGFSLHNRWLSCTNTCYQLLWVSMTVHSSLKHSELWKRSAWLTGFTASNSSTPNATTSTLARKRFSSLCAGTCNTNFLTESFSASVQSITKEAAKWIFLCSCGNKASSEKSKWKKSWIASKSLKTNTRFSPYSDSTGTWSKFS